MSGTVLITGCSSGIGQEAALAFHDDGWTVYATARDLDDLTDLAEQGCATARLDVTEPDDVERVVGRVVEEQGRIDCLVNNAGIAQAGALEEVSAEDLEYQFDVNVFGPHRLTRAVLPHMRDCGDGTVVNVSSVSGRVAFPAMGPYSGTKHAMEGMSDALRTEVAPFGIDIVLVEPGWARTRIGDKGEASLRETESADSPYRRLHQNALLVKDVLLSRPVAGDVGDVAATIVEAANADNPDPRYPVLANGHAILLGGLLPDRVRDRLFVSTFWGPLGVVRERLPV